jgi:hypothetical protein
MARLAILNNNKDRVINTVEGQPSDFPDAIDVSGTSVSIGWLYNLVTGQFRSPPIIIESPPQVLPYQKVEKRSESEWIFNEQENSLTVTYEILNKTEEEFNSDSEKLEQSLETTIVRRLLRQQISEVPDEQIDEFVSLFEPFKVGEALLAGNRRQYDGVVWEVIQRHTTQIDWLPPNVPALWKRVHSPDVTPLWVQPQGAHDAYKKGDKVQWPEGTVWESTIDANVWAPGVYGWTQI